MSDTTDNLPKKAPAHLKLTAAASQEWARVVKILEKKKLGSSADRVILEFYVTNYENFLAARSNVTNYRDLEEKNEQCLSAGNDKERAELKYIRASRQQAEEALNRAIARGLMLSQKLYLNPSSRRSGKVPNGEGKSAFDEFLD
jgi:phage terminase small subunit